MSEWISVDERLPGKSGYYLVYVKRAHVMWWDSGRDRWESRKDPIHWMPLPEPPQ